jgi:hypothetical protein
METTTTDLYCPACGKQIPVDARFCRGCGHDLTARTRAPAGVEPAQAPDGDPASAATTAVEPAPASPPAAASTVCPTCGVELRAAARFCGSCGTAVGAADPPTEPTSLVAMIAGDPAPAPAPAPAAPAAPSRHARLAALAGALALLVGGAAAFLLAGGSGPPAKNAASATVRPATTSAAAPAPATHADAFPDAATTDASGLGADTAAAPNDGADTGTGPIASDATTAPTTETETLTGPIATDTTTVPTTETSTEPSATTPAPSAPAASPPGPATVLRRHLTALGSGDYDAAFALLTLSFRARAPRWAAQRRQADPAISIQSIGTATISGASADVPVTFYARDRVATTGSDTRCRRFAGTAHMVRTGSQWRYDPLDNNLSATVLPSSNSRCP